MFIMQSFSQSRQTSIGTCQFKGQVRRNQQYKLNLLSAGRDICLSYHYQQLQPAINFIEKTGHTSLGNLSHNVRWRVIAVLGQWPKHCQPITKKMASNSSQIKHFTLLTVTLESPGRHSEWSLSHMPRVRGGRMQIITFAVSYLTVWGTSKAIWTDAPPMSIMPTVRLRMCGDGRPFDSRPGTWTATKGCSETKQGQTSKLTQIHRINLHSTGWSVL